MSAVQCPSCGAWIIAPDLEQALAECVARPMSAAEIDTLVRALLPRPRPADWRTAATMRPTPLAIEA